MPQAVPGNDRRKGQDFRHAAGSVLARGLPGHEQLEIQALSDIWQIHIILIPLRVGFLQKAANISR